MSKDMERLKSKIDYYKAIINLLDDLNFDTRSNNHNEIIDSYKIILDNLYKRIQELKEVNK